MILLKNGTYIDWRTLAFEKRDIIVGGTTNGEGVAGEVPDVIDCTGKYITRAFANGHHHVYSALARGMPAPKKNPANFPEILEYIWWNLDKSLDLEMIRSSALVTAMACAKAGVTFVIDHHASPMAVEGSLETIAQAFDETGVGHLLCYEITDRDGEAIARQGMDETARYLSKRQGLVGLHASFTVGDRTLQQALEIADHFDTGIHIHVAEDAADQEHCLQHHHCRVAERLEKAGALRSGKSILAHAIHLDSNERAILRDSPVWVVENKESNLNNRVGHFRASGPGQRIMLGTDGMHSDMLRSARAAFFAGQEHDTIDYAETWRRFRNVHHYLENNHFQGDGDDNLVVLSYDTPTPFDTSNFYGHFLFGLDAAHAEHVIARGRLIVRNRRMITVDEDQVLHEARLQARRLWNKMVR